MPSAINPSPFTAQESAIAQRMQRGGHSLTVIAEALGRSVGQVHRHLAQGRPAAAPAKKREKTLRSCLCCRRHFLSEGAHNRMCDTCRRRSDSQRNPYDPTYIS
jgi:DNA-directed RNA polymerase specialized sigma24 family protein